MSFEGIAKAVGALTKDEAREFLAMFATRSLDKVASSKEHRGMLMAFDGHPFRELLVLGYVEALTAPRFKAPQLAAMLPFWVSMRPEWEGLGVDARGLKCVRDLLAERLSELNADELRTLQGAMGRELRGASKEVAAFHSLVEQARKNHSFIRRLWNR